MQIKKLGSNMTELVTRDGRILFSYETPVAVLDHGDYEIYVTEEFFSKTTTRHINKWLEGVNPIRVPQAKIEAYVQ